MLKYFFGMCFFLITVTGFAQNSAVTGIVMSGNGELLEGVTITERGKGAIGLTDDEGRFSVAAPQGAVLIFSFTGYTTSEEVVRNEPMTIVLTAIESKMDEVVVIGYGTQRRSQITGSVSKLDDNVLQTGVRANPASALAGTIPGLRVQQSSGRPGAMPNIVLRGGTNLDGSGSPLVVVDGIVRGSLSDINPSDIETIQVLKDASATAIYGARANNGVILIQTKQGKQG